MHVLAARANPQEQTSDVQPGYQERSDIRASAWAWNVSVTCNSLLTSYTNHFIKADDRTAIKYFACKKVLL